MTHWRHKQGAQRDRHPHARQLEPDTTVIGVGLALRVLTLRPFPALTRYALVIVVVLVPAMLWIFQRATTTLADEAAIATGLTALPIPRRKRPPA